MYTLKLVVALLLVTPLLVIPSPSANANSGTDQTVLLVASPGVNHPLYRQTVLVAAPAPHGGHLGVILNRPTKHMFGTLYPGDQAAERVTEPAYFGGPIAANAVFALVYGSPPAGHGYFRVSDELFLAVIRETVDKVLAETPQHARFFIGVVQWARGELDEEIRSRFWEVRQMQWRVALRRDTSRLWFELATPPAISARLAQSKWQQAAR
jgi:putative transcriptional regulator